MSFLAAFAILKNYSPLCVTKKARTIENTVTMRQSIAARYKSL